MYIRGRPVIKLYTSMQVSHEWQVIVRHIAFGPAIKLVTVACGSRGTPSSERPHQRTKRLPSIWKKITTPTSSDGQPGLRDHCQAACTQISIME